MFDVVSHVFKIFLKTAYGTEILEVTDSCLKSRKILFSFKFNLDLRLKIIQIIKIYLKNKNTVSCNLPNFCKVFSNTLLQSRQILVSFE